MSGNIVTDGTYYYAYDSQSQYIYRAKISDFNGSTPNAGMITGGGYGEIVTPDQIKATGLSENDYQTLCTGAGIYNMGNYNPDDFDGFNVTEASSGIANMAQGGEISLDDFCDACYQLDAIIKEINSIDINSIDDDDFDGMEAALKKLIGAESAFNALQTVFNENFADIEGVDGGTKFGYSAVGGCVGTVVGIGVCAGIAAAGTALSATGIGAVIGIPLLIGAGIGYLFASQGDIDVDKINGAMKNCDQWTTDIQDKRANMEKKFISMFDKKLESYEGNIQKMMSGQDLDFSDIGSVANAFEEMTKMLSTFKGEISPLVEMAGTYGIDLGAASSKYQDLISSLNKEDDKGLTEYGDKYIQSFAEALGAQVTKEGEVIVDTQDLEELANQVQKFITDVGTNTITKNLNLNTEPLTKLIEETIKNANQDSVDDSVQSLDNALYSGGGGEYTYYLPSQQGGSDYDPSGSEYQFSIGDDAAIYSAAGQTQDAVDAAQNDGEYSNDTSGYDTVQMSAKDKAQQEIDDYLTSISTDGKSVGELETLYDSVAKSKEANASSAETLGVDMGGFDIVLGNIRDAQQKIVDDWLNEQNTTGLDFQQLEDLYKTQDEQYAEFQNASSSVKLDGFADLQRDIRECQQGIVNNYVQTAKTDGSFEELQSTLTKSNEDLETFRAINGNMDYSGFDTLKQTIQQNQQAIIDDYVQSVQTNGSFEELQNTLTRSEQYLQSLKAISGELNYGGFDTLKQTIQQNQQAKIDKYLQTLAPQGKSLPELVALSDQVSAQMQQYQSLAPELNYQGFQTALDTIGAEKQTNVNNYVQAATANLAGATTIEGINAIRQDLQMNAAIFSGLGLDASAITTLDAVAAGQMQNIVNQKELEFVQRASSLESDDDRLALSNEITGYIATLPAGTIDTSSLLELATSLTLPVSASGQEDGDDEDAAAAASENRNAAEVEALSGDFSTEDSEGDDAVDGDAVYEVAEEGGEEVPQEETQTDETLQSDEGLPQTDEQGLQVDGEYIQTADGEDGQQVDGAGVEEEGTQPLDEDGQQVDGDELQQVDNQDAEQAGNDEMQIEESQGLDEEGQEISHEGEQFTDQEIHGEEIVIQEPIADSTQPVIYETEPMGEAVQPADNEAANVQFTAAFGALTTGGSTVTPEDNTEASTDNQDSETVVIQPKNSDEGGDDATPVVTTPVEQADIDEETDYDETRKKPVVGEAEAVGGVVSQQNNSDDDIEIIVEE